VCVVLPLVAGEEQERLTLGSISVAVPTGWKGEVADDRIVLEPKIVAAPGKPGEITVLISGGSAPAASAAALVDQTWTAFAAGMTIKERKAGPATKTRSGFALQLSFGKVASGGEEASLVVGALHRAGGQAVLVVFLSDDDVFLRHAAAIGAIVDSIDVKDRAVQDDATGFPPASLVEGMGRGVAGVWVGMRQEAVASLSSTSGVDLRSRWTTIVVLPEGVYTSRLDPLGLNGRTTEALKARWPSYWGTVGQEGSTVTMRLSNGVFSQYKLEGDALVPLLNSGGSKFVRADTGPERRVDGTFARVDHEASHWGDELPKIVFRADGTFDDAFRGVAMVHNGPFGGGDGWTDQDYAKYNAAGRGAYRIRHNTLYLAYDDGRRKIMNVAVLPTGGTPDKPNGLYIGDHWVTRR